MYQIFKSLMYLTHIYTHLLIFMYEFYKLSFAHTSHIPALFQTDVKKINNSIINYKMLLRGVDKTVFLGQFT